MQTRCCQMHNSWPPRRPNVCITYAWSYIPHQPDQIQHNYIIPSFFNVYRHAACFLMLAAPTSKFRKLFTYTCNEHRKNLGQPRTRNCDRANFTTPYHEVIHPWAEPQSCTPLCRTALKTQMPPSPQEPECPETQQKRTEIANAAINAIFNNQTNIGEPRWKYKKRSPQPSECQQTLRNRAEIANSAISATIRMAHCGAALKT